MEKLYDWVYSYIGLSHSFQYKVFATIILWASLYFLRKIISRFLLQKVKNIKTRYNWIKGITYLNYFLFLIVVSPIWFSELQSLGTFIGLLTAGLAVALKDPISNVFAWAYIIVKKPFEMGDRIQINNSEGDIIDIGFFEFTMLEIKNWVKADQSTGRIIHVPNGILFTKPIINYNQAMNFIWNEIPVRITFESDWKKAKKILLDIEQDLLQQYVAAKDVEFQQANRNYHIEYNNLNPTVYTSIQDFGVLLTLRYLCHPKNRRNSEQIVFETILTEFGKHPDIHFAYPTTRFFQKPPE